MGDLRYYEVVNPSDRVTIASDNELAACIAVMLISGGSYGMRRDDGVAVLPILSFSGKTATEAWLQGQGIADSGAGLDAFITANRLAMASALESVFYGTQREMRALQLALEGLEASDAASRRARYNDERRTSLTNIEHAALAYAAKLRKLEDGDG